METDLNNVLKTQPLQEAQIVFLTYQILRGLKYLHTAGIVHRVTFRNYCNINLSFFNT